MKGSKSKLHLIKEHILRLKIENSEDHNFSSSSCSGPVNPSLDQFDFDTAIEQVAKCGLLSDHAGGSFLGRPVLYDVQN